MNHQTALAEKQDVKYLSVQSAQDMENLIKETQIIQEQPGREFFITQDDGQLISQLVSMDRSYQVFSVHDGKHHAGGYFTHAQLDTSFIGDAIRRGAFFTVAI